MTPSRAVLLSLIVLFIGVLACATFRAPGDPAPTPPPTATLTPTLTPTSTPTVEPTSTPTPRRTPTEEPEAATAEPE